MIFTERQITVHKGKSTINEPVILYRGDYEVSIKFTIMESKFRFKSGVNLVDSEKASHGQLAILAPYGGNVFSEIVKCEDGTVTFTLTKEMIDQLEEVGLYSFQIRLFDYYRESRVSIPPVEFGIEVREPVASEDHDNTVNEAIVGYSIAKVVDPSKENVGDTFDANGNYNKTDWETGDRISEGKLNKIEDALDKINQNEKNDVAALDKRVTNNFNTLNSTKADVGASISVSQINKNLGKIDQTYLSDDLIQQIAGNAAVNAVPADDSITKSKMTYDSIYYDNFIGFEQDPRYNLIDVDNLNTKGFYREADGKWHNDNSYGSTGFIRIDPNVTYYVKTAGHITLWDESFNFIPGGKVNNGLLVLPSEGAERVRYVNSALLLREAGDKYITANPALPLMSRYSHPKLLLNIDNIDMDTVRIDCEHANFIDKEAPTRNLFNKYEASTTYFYDASTGIKTPNKKYCATNFMPVDYTKEYIGSTGGHITYWDADKNFLFGNNGNSTAINGDSRVKYCVMTYDKDSIDTWMCVETNTTQGGYTKYESIVLKPYITITEDNLNSSISETLTKINKPVSKNNTDFIVRERTINLFNVDNMNMYGYYDPNNGAYTMIDNYGSSELIEVEEGEYYTISPKMGHVTFFDKDKKYVGGDNSTWIGPVPLGVKYISWVIHIPRKDQVNIVKGQTAPANFIPYYTYTLDETIKLPVSQIEQSELRGLKWNVMGDSISSISYANGHPYWYHLANQYDMTVRNYAKSGAWISKGGDQTISEVWETMNDDADMITVFAGTNDNLSVNPLGVMSDRTNTTFYGALHVLYSGLINKYPGKKIGIISIMSRSGYYPNDDSVWDKKNKAILEVAAYYNLPVFKAHEELGLSANIPIYREKYIEDGLHPNEAAHRDIIARRLKSWLESL
jgi:lysophospholipase L1-like esterase